MVTDQQVRRMRMLIRKEKTQAIASSKAGMDEKTARKYLKMDKLPSECRPEHTWQTRHDPFKEDWNRLEKLLEVNPGLEAKTLFNMLQREIPGKYEDGQLRTLQRRIKVWRATKGPAKEIFFSQKHMPGKLCASDFSHMSKLGIRIQGEEFNHLLYHFVLPYSNWETGTICFSESFESLSEGLQNALWKLGGVPLMHRTDRLSAAVHKECNPEEFTQRYKELLRHYNMGAEKIQAGKANENGDVEQRHYRFKRGIEQSLLIRGSRDFTSRREYELFVEHFFTQVNAGRQSRFQEELALLKRLPKRKLDACKRLCMRVGPSSTINVAHNTYSVKSQLIGEWIDIRLYMEHIEIWYAQKVIEKISRIRGERKHFINYRHIIDWLVRKPGAFENYRYKEDLFPSSSFRIAYDILRETHTLRIAHKEYLKILHLAARENETRVEEAIRDLLDQQEALTYERIEQIVKSVHIIKPFRNVEIAPVCLSEYDVLLSSKMEVASYG